MNAALTQMGLAYLPEDHVQTPTAEGRLIRVLADWCPSFPDYHLVLPELSPTFVSLRVAGLCASPQRLTPPGMQTTQELLFSLA